jgi:soluble lytic murein transglycosylase
VHIRFLSWLPIAAAVIAGSAWASSLDQQRERFVAAEQALDQADLAAFARLEKSLRSYPLHPYLVYSALRKRLDEEPDREIAAFLQTHDGTPVAQLMRRAWLNHLAKQRRWQTFLSFYQPSKNVTRQCQHLQALIATGRTSEALPQVQAIWLHGKSRPKACDPVFRVWREAGKQTDELVWKRIEKAMASGESGLANWLGRSLPDRDQVWVKRWVRLYQSPDSVTHPTRFSEPHPYRESMLVQAVRRLARWDGVRALGAWEQIRDRYPFDSDQVRDVEYYLIRNLVRAPEPPAYAFVRSVEVSPDATLVNAARTRAALLHEDWPQVERWIDAMSPEQRNEIGWRYWRARAVEGQGRTAEAERLYAEVAKERSYYGFMAADRIGVDYHLAHAETPVSKEMLQRVASLEGVARARELFALERWSDARREWRAATSDLDAKRLKAAARLAKDYGWHDRAIFTLAKTDYWDDLELRFPLEHSALVEENAARHGIDIAWVFAVMRQESAFMQNARSHAGAMGLMQLMPATARSVARDMLNRKPPARQEILRPATNIALGSAYLKQMKGELGDSAVLATAAYNAGPHRVARWLPQRTLPADIWIELVPFRETRGYLRRVLAYTVIYEKRLGRTPKRLNERLHPVPPHISMIALAEQSAS